MCLHGCNRPIIHLRLQMHRKQISILTLQHHVLEKMYLSFFLVITMPGLIKTSHLSEKKILNQLSKSEIRNPSVSPSHPLYRHRQTRESGKIGRRNGKSICRRYDMMGVYCQAENGTYARTHVHSPRSHTHVHSRQFCSVRKLTLVIRSCLFCSIRTYACARARLVAYIIVRLISVINILRTAITRGSVCSRNINYGCDCGDGCGEGK